MMKNEEIYKEISSLYADAERQLRQMCSQVTDSDVVFISGALDQTSVTFSCSIC